MDFNKLGGKQLLQKFEELLWPTGWTEQSREGGLQQGLFTWN